MAKPAFDPSKPFEPAAGDKPAFDPSAPFAPSGPSISSGEAGLRGALQGATGRFGDELAAMAAPATDAIFEFLHPEARKIPAATARADLKERERTMNAAAKEQHPWLYGLTEAAGALPATFAAGSALAPLKAAQGAGLAARLGAAAGNGAIGGGAIGGITGAGGSEAQDASGVAGDSLAGAGIGALFGGALGGLGGAWSNRGDVGEAIQGMARRRAVASINPTATQIGKLKDSIGLDRAGKEILDAGLKPWNGAEALAGKTKDALKQAGSTLGDLYTAADAAGAEVHAPSVLDEARQQLLAPMANKPTQAGAARQLSEMIDALSEQYGKSNSIANARELEKELGQAAYGYKGAGDPTTNALKDAYKNLRGMVSDAVDSSASSSMPGSSGALSDANGSYRALKMVSDIAKKSANRGDTSILSGHGVVDIAKNALGRYANPASAYALNKIGGAIGSGASTSAGQAAAGGAAKNFSAAFPKLVSFLGASEATDPEEKLISGMR